jgi:hypothetical protein
LDNDDDEPKRGPGILRPNTNEILDHITALMGDEMDGTFEIAWTIGRPLSGGKVYTTDQIEIAAERAAEENERAGSNAYIGLCVKQTATFVDGRTSDGDYMRTSFVAVDLDEEGAHEEARAKYNDLNLRPTFAVVTGLHPHTRTQLYWKLDEPFSDPEIHKELMRGLALAFGGDRAVSNPGRVLRLGGTIAWAHKPGRKNEMTKFRRLSGQSYPTSRLLALAREAIADERGSEPGQKSGLGLEAHVGVDIDRLLRDTRASEGAAWRENALRLTASLVARGLPDSAILAMAEAMTAPGWTVGQTVADMEIMIRGARSKGFDKDAPREAEPTVAQVRQVEAAEGFDILAWDIAKRFAAAAPPLEWIIEGVMEKASLGVIAGMGGIGKSLLALDACIAVANRPTIGAARVFGNIVHEHGNAVFMTGEDSADSVHRRIEGLDRSGAARRKDGRVFVVPLPNQAGVAPILTADGMRGIQISPAFETVRRQLKRVSDLRLIVLDPLQVFVQADLNDPATTQAWWTLMGELAAETGAAILATHHMNKASLTATTLEEARQGIRGNTGVVDGARMAYALWKAPNGEGDKIAMGIGLDPEQAEIIMGGVVKINGPGDKRVHLFVRRESGLLEDITDSAAAPANAPGVTEALASAIGKEIARAWDEGKPWSMNARAKTHLRYLPEYAARTWGMDRHAIESLMSDWQANAIVTVEVRDRSTKASGLKMLAQPW